MTAMEGFMSLRASLVNQGEITVIALEGKLDFENQDVLKESILNLTRQGKRVIVDMEGLNFVGSSGITHFIRSLYELQERGLAVPHLCNVKSEFRKIISAYDVNRDFAIHETRELAVTGFFRAGESESH
jgi:anti-anti-sigma factor